MTQVCWPLSSEDKSIKCVWPKIYHSVELYTYVNYKAAVVHVSDWWPGATGVLRDY